MPIILATWEAEIRRLQFEARKIVHETQCQKKKITKRKRGAGGVAQGVGREFKHQY
jgi:hypothetical protein